MQGTTMKAILLAALASVSAASRLYAASYAGLVSTLSLAAGNASTGHLSVVSQSQACGASPSWLTLDRHHDILYCLDEGVNTPNGSITSFHTMPDGSLTPINLVETITGPVMSVLYSASGLPGRQFMAVAHYEGSAVTTYSIDPATRGLFSPVQNFTFHMDAPGPNPSRQDAPHPHGAYVDPSGRYVLVPDLGADLIRIFAIDQLSGGLKPVRPFVTEPGLGPRHVAFWLPRGAVSVGDGHGEVYMYLVSELTNTVTGFRVGYSAAGMSFTKVYKESTFGQDKPGPEGSKASAITVSPQNTHLIISNRLDHTFGSNNDSFALFSIANANGSAFAAPSFHSLRPAYGSNPRQFDISDSAAAVAGGGRDRLVATAIQDSHEVVVARWDVAGQAPGALYAKVGLEGEVPAVVWDS